MDLMNLMRRWTRLDIMDGRIVKIVPWHPDARSLDWRTSLHDQNGRRHGRSRLKLVLHRRISEESELMPKSNVELKVEINLAWDAYIAKLKLLMENLGLELHGIASAHKTIGQEADDAYKAFLSEQDRLQLEWGRYVDAPYLAREARAGYDRALTKRAYSEDRRGAIPARSKPGTYRQS